jgi:hypothetical protein
VTRRLTDTAIAIAEKKVGRRGFLVRAAVSATALAYAPVRYLLHPADAFATVTCTYGDGCGNFYACTCPSCSCTAAPCYSDHYTAFCCTQYGSNTCPADTFIGGWWKCTASQYCLGAHGAHLPRYYLDCNALCMPNHTGCQQCGGLPALKKYCNSGDACSYDCTSYRCHCANGTCTNRHSACIWFRYGQCNTDTHPCFGPVVCRIVSCDTPWTTHNCTSSSQMDDVTCDDTATCL